MNTFKKDFVWGAATSSYQIEGGAFQDGRGLSIWDTFCSQKDRIWNGHTGDIACDHYNRYIEDVKLMKEIGIKAYRFSIAWSRILPDGIGKVNPKGIAFYHNLIDALIRNGIEPYITLFHWDYPQSLYNKGGWLNSESPKWFAYYAKVVAENFGDRVKHFFTLNEPQCFIGIGYGGYWNGHHAPGIKLSQGELAVMVHNTLLAHGLAVQAIKEQIKDAKVGFAPCGDFYYPSDESNAQDIQAARNKTFDTTVDSWIWSVATWCDPVYLGSYPKVTADIMEQYLPQSWEKDMKIINQPLDFIGQNIYSGQEAKGDLNGDCQIVKQHEGYPTTAIGWYISPPSIKWAAKFLYDRYQLPIYITENGISCNDVVSLDGKIHDANRIDFIHRHLLKLEEAIQMGVDVNGYFYWSLMDNFEWAEGYKQRFGLLYVDYPTQKRIIKDSGYFYQEIIANNGATLSDNI